MSAQKSTRGFTLIELLIVIVIIGILAGVVIAIINPAQQQARARDAVIKAAVEKLVLSTKGYVSAFGRVPEVETFKTDFNNATPANSTCVATGSGTVCELILSGVTMPSTCTAQNWNGSGSTNSSPCFFRYVVGQTNGGMLTPGRGGNSFRLYAKSAGDNTRLFLYEYTPTSEGFYDCPGTMTDDTATSGTCNPIS